MVIGYIIATIKKKLRVSPTKYFIKAQDRNVFEGRCVMNEIALTLSSIKRMVLSLLCKFISSIPQSPIHSHKNELTEIDIILSPLAPLITYPMLSYKCVKNKSIKFKQ